MKIRGPLKPVEPTHRHPDEPKPGAYPLDAERIADSVAAASEREYAAPDLLSVTADTLTAVRDAAATLGADTEGVKLAADQAAVRVREGFYLLDPEAIPASAAALATLLDRAVALTAFVGETENSAIRTWAEKVKTDPAELAKLARLTVNVDPEKLAAEQEASGLEAEAFWFVFLRFGMQVLTPFADALAPLVDDTKWNFAHCPICGNQPAVAGLVGDGGKRHLQCGMCHFVWTFPRLKCVACGNEDHEKLPRLSIDDESPYVLDACSECNNYLKSIDYRKMPSDQAAVLPVEDAATVFLDIMAADEGFGRKSQ
jgi:FdhE protein